MNYLNKTSINTVSQIFNAVSETSSIRLLTCKHTHFYISVQNEENLNIFRILSKRTETNVTVLFWNTDETLFIVYITVYVCGRS